MTNPIKGSNAVSPANIAPMIIQTKNNQSIPVQQFTPQAVYSAEGVLQQPIYYLAPPPQIVTSKTTKQPPLHKIDEIVETENTKRKLKLPEFKDLNTLIQELKEFSIQPSINLDRIKYTPGPFFSPFQKMLLAGAGLTVITAGILTFLMKLNYLQGPFWAELGSVLSLPYMIPAYVGLTALLIGGIFYLSKKYWQDYTRIVTTMDKFQKDLDLDKTKFKEIMQLLANEVNKLNEFENDLNKQEKKYFKDEIKTRKILIKKQLKNLIELIIKFMNDKNFLTTSETKILNSLFDEKIVLTKLILDHFKNDKFVSLEKIQEYINDLNNSDKLKNFLSVIRRFYNRDCSLSDRKLLEQLLDKNFVAWKLSGSKTTGYTHKVYLIYNEKFTLAGNGYLEKISK